MTADRRIFLLWLEATAEMNRTSDSRHTYFLGKVTGLVDAYAAIRGLTFVEASRELLNRDRESLTHSAA